MKNEYFDTLGLMIDLSRDAVMTIEAWQKYLPLIAEMGYDRIFLYTEDTYEVEGEPMFGYMRGRYSIEEQRKLVELGDRYGIEMVPCIQTLGHLTHIFKWGVYPNDTPHTLLVGDERTYELIENMFRTLSKIYKCKTVHVGMDEAHNIGRENYLKRFGYESQAQIMKKHLDRVKAIADKYGFTLMIWSDMFFRPWNDGAYYTTKTKIPEEYRKALPSDVIPVYWDYYMKTPDRYDDMLSNHEQLSDKTWFAGGIWTWLGFVPSNIRILETATPAVQVCRKRGVRNIFFTSWGDDGGECSRFSVLAGLYYVSEICKGNEDMDSIKSGFEKRFGISFDDYMTLDEPNTVGFDGTEEFPVSSAGKHLLYSDPLLGFLDFTVPKNANRSYADIADRLLSISERDFEYAYLFKTEATLARILANKAELGIMTRSAYKRGDKEELRRLIDNEYAEIEALLPKFIEQFRYQWTRENKYIGLEVHEARLGGLYERIKAVRKRLTSYVNGETDRLEELEYEIIPFGGRKPGKPIFYCRYNQEISANTTS